jgi:hypothetical protein
MGDRQSVVVLKRGDWVIADGEVKRVDKNLNNHIFFEREYGFLLPSQVTKIDPALNQILSDSISKGE